MARQLRSSPEQLEKYLFEEQSGQFIATVAKSQSVSGIHHPDQGIRLLEVVAPV